MKDKISEDAYQDLLDAIDYGSPNDIVKAFGDIGIFVKPYTAYQFYDCEGGNFIGDLNWDDVDDILRRAEIEVVFDGN